MNTMRTRTQPVRKNVIKKAPQPRKGVLENAWDGLKILLVGWLGLAAFGTIITDYIAARF
jgi:hypothetical protein